MDVFDPRTWEDRGPQKVWLTDEVYAVVDEIDYPFISRFMWRASFSRVKRYAVRTVRDEYGRFEQYMHKLVLLRHVGPANDHRFHIGDHINGNGLDNRRCNLRWATWQDNNLNKYGFYSKQLHLLEDENGKDR